MDVLEGCFRPVALVLVSGPDALGGTVDCFKPGLVQVEREKEAIEDLFCSLGA